MHQLCADVTLFIIINDLCIVNVAKVQILYVATVRSCLCRGVCVYSV